MKKKWIINVLALFVFMLLGIAIFHKVMFSSEILMITDDNVSAIATRHNQLPAGFIHNWFDTPLLGTSNVNWPINITNILYWVCDPLWLTNHIHFIYLTAGSFLLFLFMRRQNLHPASCALASLTAYWVGSNLTLTYAGHIPKFAIMSLASGALLCISFISKFRIFVPTLLLGMTLALAFTEQQDVATFTALPIIAYYFFRLILSRPALPKLILSWVITAIVAALIMSAPFINGYQSSVKGVTAMEKPFAERWAYATQWSWPPEETIAFVAPGYTGWRSGEPEGPYWGRMGRSDGWEQTGQGFRNFKLENTYLGFIPVIFALFAFYAIVRRLQPEKMPDSSAHSARKEIVFWSAASLFTLLLAFGKFFPLYRVLFMLPLINSIRNPNKFLQVFQICFGILSAWGLDIFLRGLNTSTEGKKKTRLFFYFLCTLCGLWGLWLIAGITSNQTTSLIQQGWGNMSGIIARNKTMALFHGLIILAIVTSCFFFLQRNVAKSKAVVFGISVLLIIFAAGDSFLLSRHYVTTMPQSWIEKNVVTEELQKELNHNRTRVATLSQQGFYNIWLTYLLPYHDIPAFNFTQMPRMAEEYRLLLQALQRDPIRLWQLCGVGAVFLPQNAITQINNMPQYRNLISSQMGFTVQPTPDNNFATIPVGNEQAQHFLCGLSSDQSGRYMLIDGVKKFATVSEELQWMASPGYVPFDQVAVESKADIPDLTGHGRSGSVNITSYDPATIIMETKNNKSAILRCADRYDPNWKAVLDGKPTAVFRVDYCMMGMFVPDGTHTISLMYRPSTIPFYLQIIGYFLGIFLVCILSINNGKTFNS